MRRPPLVLAALMVGVALTATACTSSDSGVGTGVVSRSTVTEVVDVPASVTARAVATLTAPADGTLARLTVTPGATVEKGTIVAVIDSPSARKRLADARAALSATGSFGATSSAVNLTGVQRSLDASAADAFASARTAAASVADPQLKAALLAQVDAAQKHYTAESAAVTKVLGQVQRGVAGIGQAMAALGAAQRAQARAAYDLAKSEVDALTMRAPISGVIQLAGPSASSGSGDALSALLSSGAAGALSGAGAGAGSGAAAAGASTGAPAGVAGVDDVLAVGDRVSAGAAVVTVVDVSEIGLVGEVDETDVLLVAAGVGADVELDAAPGQRYEATVRTIDLLPTPSSRGGVAYRVRLAFTDATGANGGQAPPTPRPGMSAVAHLRVRTATDAVVVPASAVFTSGSGDAVWVVGDDGRAVSQPVTLGVQGEDLVQVRSGLRPGQRVVVTGTDKVSAGDTVS